MQHELLKIKKKRMETKKTDTTEEIRRAMATQQICVQHNHIALRFILFMRFVFVTIWQWKISSYLQK